MNRKFGRMTMCHMIADTLEELHAMADKIGIKRKWFQEKASHPHYDICLSKKELAIENGAKAITWRETFGIIKKIKKSKLCGN
ncbi:MAG: DUF4031 domain-containing protein [Melioribacteraceae bacterium]|nr:DUF4031 domain-containing protein [Melioribacteraceae bacterium]